MIEYRYESETGRFSQKESGVWYSDLYDVQIADIPAGETGTVTYPIDYSGDIDIRYRVQPAAAKWVLETN